MVEGSDVSSAATGFEWCRANHEPFVRPACSGPARAVAAFMPTGQVAVWQREGPTGRARTPMAHRQPAVTWSPDGERLALAIRRIDVVAAPVSPDVRR